MADQDDTRESYRRANPSRGEPASLQDVLSALFALQPQNASHVSIDAGGNTRLRVSELTLRDMARLLSSRPVTTADQRSASARAHHSMVADDDDDDDEYIPIDDDDDDEDTYNRPARRRGRPFFPPVTEPKKEGLELLASGDFGRVGVKSRGRRNRANIARTILGRGSHPIPLFNREDILNKFVPNTNGTTVAIYDANMYTAQFSDDFKLHIFDMRAPPLTHSTPGPSSRSMSDSGLTTRMPLRKVIQGHPGRWTITDANLSPDNERCIFYSSTSPDGNNSQIPIPFADHPSGRGHYHSSFGIWSCRFSADGNEIVAGGDGKLFVYDLLANKRTVKIQAHEDDVNSCCWADTASGNVLVSASDDTYIKVWDRRSLGSSRKPSGVLVGHTEGITYVSAKGDGRYIVSNGKDQAARLWDLRKMRSSAEFDEIRLDRRYYGIPEFDYRYPYYPEPNYPAHPKDCSVMTFRGHSVLRTLIRCHFSPAESTGSQYIYSGSANGLIHEPVIMSAGWENARGGTVIARHEYKGLSKMPGALEDWVEKNRLETEETENRPRRSGRLAQQRGLMPGTFHHDEDEEEDEDDFDFF
ncbi:LEC14B-like protein [Psilocybe cubensis]|uniref:LEC14B-like protein n=1 Tax=Psilocybe cubensis TaxID=181762 RepID=A0ACB8HEC5_PSICU|nr:LEC14B-like protein [Psilocybe cubensis]KAH9486363.1 LEC14B-like protein [Psilocybe cubensis]